GPVSAQSELKYPKIVRFSSLSPGSLLYILISGLSKVASNNSPMTVVVIPTAGATTWLPMMTDQGTIDIGMENFASIANMWTGVIAPEPIPKGFGDKSPYPKTPTVRILNAGPAFKMSFLVRKDSGMKYVRELKGKRIAWEWTAFPPNIAITLASLLNGGLTIEDVKTVPVTEVVSAVKAVQEGRIDATVCALGMSAVAEADALVGVRFLHGSMDPKMIKEGQRAMPGCYPTVQPAGPPGIPENTPLWSAPLANVVTTRMPDHVAYKLVEAWWNHYKDYQAIHPLLRFWTPQTFVNPHFTMPYHAGAIQFYKDKGVWTSELEQKQEKLLRMK
ncbi:MAG: ABC transporter substrate-binding protein, partial [Desulfobacteraceae bacterium]|nr:ABC transporter substrate-binding protein [Desulfobacteraceae bacterium]